MMTPLLSLALAHLAPTTIAIHVDQPGAKVSPSLYGIFFEEINQAGDGGVYAELLRNRGLETKNGPGGFPLGWTNVSGTTLDETDGPNAAHTRSLRIEKGGSVANSGFWGVPLAKGDKYKVILWAKGEGTVGVGFGEKPIPLGKAGAKWTRFEKTIRAEGSSTAARFVVSAEGGPVSVGFASLIPEKTWKGRKNGLRLDLAEKVDAMSPAFVRFPGGCYVEGGDRFSDAFDWKRSVGPIEGRQGLDHSMWGYPNTFGLGYHEYLQWCEDLGAAPLFVVNAGIDHREVAPMGEMTKWVDDALDAIEYANGPVTSKWGAERAKNGHPKPFGLKYVEIGNENGGGFHGGNEAYEPRYRLIYDAIKAKYPEIQTISNTPLRGQPMEIVDEHYYSDPAFFWRNMDRYDAYDRKGPKVYVGEYAVTQESGAGNLDAALGEAAFMAGMERNADVVTMSSYAPLFVNVNNKQWNPNAIVFDNARTFGTPSYHVQAMFANNRADRNVGVDYPKSFGEAPKHGGGVGLMTWNTEAEFSDVVLAAGGKTLYSSKGIGAAGLDRARGEWSVANGTIHQTERATNRTVSLKGATAPDGDYTLTLRARKIAGSEGFLIVFDEKDGRRMDWNVGGWDNTLTGFERNGSIIGDRVPVTVEAGRWYDVRIERKGDVLRGYLDGKLVQEIVEAGAPDLAVVAGVDEKAKEIVVKVVNGSDVPRATTLDLPGASLKGTGRAIVLTGPSFAAENAFATPNLVAPVENSIQNVVSGMAYTFAPRSVTVLRLAIR